MQSISEAARRQRGRGQAITHHHRTRVPLRPTPRPAHVRCGSPHPGRVLERMNRQQLRIVREGEPEADGDDKEDGGRAAFMAALADYVHATAATGAATVFVFRDELNQVLTYAFAASRGAVDQAPERLAEARAKLSGAVVQPAWTALTQWKDAAQQRRAALKEAISVAAREAVSQAQDAASTWTTLAFSEYARTQEVARGHLLIASLRDILERVLTADGGPDRLGTTDDFKAMVAEIGRFAPGETAARSFGREDVSVLPTYELLRRGTMPKAQSVFGQLLNGLLGDGKPGTVREQRIDGSTLPEFDVVRKYFGTVGTALEAFPDGWRLTGVALPRSGQADPEVARTPSAEVGR